MGLVGLFVICALALAAAPAAAADAHLYIDSPEPVDFRDSGLQNHFRRLAPDDTASAEAFNRVYRHLSAESDIPEDVVGTITEAIRRLSQCPNCGYPLDSSSLDFLECDHQVHQYCFLAAGKICPVCKHQGPHYRRNRHSELRGLLKFLEGKRWTSPMRIYPDSLLPVVYDDPDLQTFMLHFQEFGSGRSPSTVLELVYSQFVEAVAQVDNRAVVELFGCSFCFGRCDSRSLALLRCHHHVHNECFLIMNQRSEEGWCPVCRVYALHSNRNRPSFLRSVLEFFESKRWIPEPKLYHDSAVAVNYYDLDLRSLLSYEVPDENAADLPLMEALRREDASETGEATLRSFFRCPYCYYRLDASSLAVLRCGCGIHEECFKQRLGELRTFCPKCGAFGPHTRRSRHTLLRSVLELFEFKLWALPLDPAPNVLFPGSLVAVNYNDPILLSFVSTHLPLGLEAVLAAQEGNTAALAGALECSVCYRQLVPDNFDLLGCGHIVHKTCVRQDSKCPYCLVTNDLTDPSATHALGELLDLFCDRGWMPKTPVTNRKTSQQLHLAPLVHILELFRRRDWLTRSAQQPQFPNEPPVEVFLDVFENRGWVPVFSGLSLRETPICGVCGWVVSDENHARFPCGHRLHQLCVSCVFAGMQCCPMCTGHETPDDTDRSRSALGE